MYLPAHFEMPSTADMHRVIQAHPFGVLVTRGPGGMEANHLPFELDPQRGRLGVLAGHVSRKNPVWEPGSCAADVLVIFQSVEGYISPNWYPSKHETQRQVPTWNYEVVHASGTLAVRDDERFVRGLVARLTRRHEAAQPLPWKMGDAPVDYIDEMLRSIVGLEITITSLVGKAKLGQNKDVRDREGAADALARLGRHELADAMRAASRRAAAAADRDEA